MTMKSKQPKPKRRWLRFSLRAFAIAITILCIWLGCYVYRVDRQRDAVQWVLENGGHVHYDYHRHQNGDYVPDSLPPVPTWMLDILDIHYFASVEYVTFHDPNFSDLTPVANLTNLKWLDLFNTQVSDLTPLANMSNLEHLWLHQTQAGDEEIKKLKQELPNCKIHH